MSAAGPKYWGLETLGPNEFVTYAYTLQQFCFVRYVYVADVKIKWPLLCHPYD